jgi:hypothetical protein
MGPCLSNSRWRLIVCLLLGFGFMVPQAGAKTVTYADLAHRIADLEYLSVLPQDGEKCGQWSSYDRASKYDASTGKYIHWDANNDGVGFIQTEGDQQVLAEMKGPGVIWRIWSADPKQGHVRIYLDGASEPAVDLPFMGYFDHKNAPFTRPHLVHEVSKGWNCYVPIPYHKSCKIVADKNWGHYFHFTYGTFPPGTTVPTFKRELTPEENAALEAADQALANVGVDPAGKRNGEQTEQAKVTVEPGSTQRVARFTGPEAITALRVKLDLPPSPADRDLLRELALKITWDDDAKPAVWAPLGDFFGTAAGANPYRSLPLGLTKDGQWYCYWYMPFAKSATIELTNDSKEPHAVSFEITHAPLDRPIEQLARFHAKWHRDAFLPSDPDRKIDWTVLTTTGRGRFVGMMLHIWNPRGGWWGEGDEKFFVDGEKFPSTFGTGSEDYFGYAWGDPALFQHALHNQTISEHNRGHISVNRWHICDSVPFQTSFDGDIEKYFPNTRPTLYAAMAYWYLAPGGRDPYGPVPVDQRIGYWTPVKPNVVPGAIEAERMRVLAVTGGNPHEQEMDGFEGRWSNDSQLWWTGAKPGDALDLALPVAKGGTYKLTVQLTKARDYAITQILLDGKPLGQPIDLYAPNVSLARPFTSDPVDLSAGDHKLTFRIAGANDKAVKSYMVGIDYVKLDPAGR